ncbi:MAG: HAD-IIB family hydrolase [Ureaplasma sp.]|nr:HAD-IIB family hydrolase [Ureaplasma sp.]
MDNHRSKLLALDLDGTIVSHGFKISKKNMKAMVEFIEKGNQIVFITGRPFYTSKTVADYFYQKTGKKIPYICALKGALIYDNINEKVLFENSINNDLFNDLYNIALKNKMVLTGYCVDDFLERKIQSYNVPKIWWPFLRNKHISKRFGKPEFNQFNQSNFYKFNLLKKRIGTNLTNVVNEINLKFPEILDVSKTNGLMIEITLKNANKSFALKYVSDLLNIDLKDTIAFGDSGNDLPMLKIAGISVIINAKKAKKTKFHPDYILNKPIKKALSYLINKKLLNTM